MFTLEVEYLTGRAVATARHAREEAEWPPHPSRLFSALVDAAFQTFSEDGVDLPSDIQEALEWLEALPPPKIAATEAGRREVLRSYVPLNDNNDQGQVVKGKMKLFPVIGEGIGLRRLRAERFFPTVVPDHPVIYFIWPSAPEVERHRATLERLSEAVTYLGHSSSLVRVALADSSGAATYEPDRNGIHRFRVTHKGRLKELLGLHRRFTRPSPGPYAAYRKVEQEQEKPPVSIRDPAFGDVIVCELDRTGPHLPLPGAVKLLAAVRDAMIRATDADTPVVKSLVSGYAQNGDPSRDEHIAYIPLANVGFPYSDGRVMGFGLVLPRTLGRFSEERRAVVRAVAGLPPILIAGAHEWAIAMPTEGAPRSLQTWAYTDPSKAWASVTPVLCDRHPKERDGERLEDVIADSIERVIGVRPVHVEAGPISWQRGVPPSHTFPCRLKEGDQPRHRAHVLLAFEHEVRGPILAGAGRYRGLGLFRVWKPEVQR